MIYDIDGNGAISFLADGILILRYVLGYRGQKLIAGAVAVGAPRSTAPEIEGYLDSIQWTLDVGGDGKVELGDALLILRYMQGLTGLPLTQGAVSAGSIRDTEEKIAEYLAKMVT